MYDIWQESEIRKSSVHSRAKTLLTYLSYVRISYAHTPSQSQVYYGKRQRHDLGGDYGRCHLR